MTLPSPSISTKNFAKMISGKEELPRKIVRELGKAGMADLLHKKRINHQETLKAIRHLRKKGLMPKTDSPSQTWLKTALKQAEQDWEFTEKIKQRHLNAYLAEEISEYDQDRKKVHYDPRSVLGKARKKKNEEEEEEKKNKKRPKIDLVV